MSNRRSIFFLLLVMWCILAPFAFAQTAPSTTGVAKTGEAKSDAARTGAARTGAAKNALPKTGASGVVIDAQTSETLPFVQVYFMGTTIGTTSDMDGNFSLTNEQGLITMAFQMIGYKTQLLTLKPNRVQKDLTIRLETDVYGLEEVVVTPKTAKKEKYKRKGNPAVELVQQVIAHKDSNRVDAEEHYKTDTYEKLIMALDKFDVDFEKNKLYEKFRFLQKYIDTTQFNNTPVLTISLREVLAEEYHTRKPNQTKRHVVAKRMQGIDDILDKEGLASNVNASYQAALTDILTFEHDRHTFVRPEKISLGMGYRF